MAAFDGKKASLFFCGLAFQIHILTIASNGYQLEEGIPGSASSTCTSSHSDAVKAFLIIAYLVYLAAFIIGVLGHHDVPISSNHAIHRAIISAALLLGAASMVISVAITGYCNADDKGNVSVPYTVTSYALAAASAVVSVVLGFCA